jgi:hypothetical protein
LKKQTGENVANMTSVLNNLIFALDHLVIKFEILLAQWFLEKIFPIETGVKMLYPIMAPPNPMGT